MTEQFKDKVVLITGGSSGIGKALATEAIKRGAKVAVCARNLAKLQKAFDHPESEQLLLCAADVTKYSDCEKFIRETITQWGRIDWVINNAGISMRALFEDLDLSVIDALMNVNFKGAVQITQLALPFVKKQKGGIVGVSSIAGYRGLPGRTGYSASKFALQGFLETLRTEFLYSGVHVMWVCPGFTNSNIRNTALVADGSVQGETPLDEGNLMSAERCAALIFKAMSRRKRTLVMTTQGKLTVWLNKLFPGLIDKIVFNHFAKESGSPLHK